MQRGRPGDCGGGSKAAAVRHGGSRAVQGAQVLLVSSPHRTAERAAKQGKVGMWHNYVPQTGNSAKLRWAKGHG